QHTHHPAARPPPARPPAPTAGAHPPPAPPPRRTDPRTARALVALLDGICLHVLLTGGEYDEEYARDALTRVLGAEAGPRSAVSGAE
ncbi:hypothetical protein ABZ129_08035, partial [Streptomyces sp. NPDC006307]